MFTEPITHINMPDAIAAIYKEVVILRKEVEELKPKETNEWIKLSEAKALAGFSKPTLRKKLIENGTPIVGKVRFQKKNARFTLYNRMDILNLNR